MRINKIENKSVDVTLDASELVTLSNLMYFYEQHHEEYPNVKSPDASFHDMDAQILLATNVCQYGHMDDFAAGRYIRHKLAARPDGDIRKFINESVEKESE